MGKFAENLNLGKRVRPPWIFDFMKNALNDMQSLTA